MSEMGRSITMDADSSNRWKRSSAGRSSAGGPEPSLSTDVQQTHSPPNQADLISEESSRGRGLKNLMLANSWFVSLIVHLVILILLSLVSYSIHTGSNLELELAQSPADDPTFMIESDDSDSNDGNNLDVEVEQMLASSEAPAKFEINSEAFEFDPQLALEKMDGADVRTSNATEGLIKSDRKVGNGNDANFFGIQATGKNFVFIVDSSGSMEGARWKNAVRELKTSLEALQENQRFYVIFFDHQTHLMFQGRVDRYRKSKPLKMINATEENVVRVAKWLRRVDLGSQTKPKISFDYGLSLEPDAIFFLTDGEFSDGTYEFLMGIAAQSSNVPTIHTVAFGNRFAGRALEEIAERFKGKYRFVR